MLTAVEDLLVSLYRPSSDPQPADQLLHETSPPPSSPLQTDAPQPDNERSDKSDITPNDHGGDILEDAPGSCDADLSAAANADVSPKCQTSMNSSSSSIAEDWIVNQIPGGLESNLSLYDDDLMISAASKSPEKGEDSLDKLSAEDWSRGTALTDPVSGEPLQPVTIHQPSKPNHSDSDDKNQSGSNKKFQFNVITEKRAALTAYDLISNRVTRAPLSPAALFEKEARAEILREKPAASLQDINVAVHERWKNLREEDRKK